MLPLAHPSPCPKPHLSWFSHFCTTHDRVSLYFTMACPFRPQNCLFSWGSGPHLIRGSLGPRESSTQTASRSVQLFCRVHYCDRQPNRPHCSVCNNSRVPTNLELSGIFVNLEKSGNLRCCQGIFCDMSHGSRLAYR